MSSSQQIQSELKNLAELANKRNDKLYAWLRWLVLLSAGFFSLMAGQLTGKPFLGVQLLMLKLALALNAAGILSGSVALYGEVHAVRQLTINHKERLASILNSEDGYVPSDIVVAKPHVLMRASEWACYLALLGSLLFWCAFIVLL